MPTFKKITAKPGMRIRVPGENYRVLPEEGTIVQWSMYWAKAVERGEIDAEDYTPPAEADQQKGKAKAKAPEAKTQGIAVS